MGKSKERKWNRTNEFARKKSTPRKVGHPVLVYAKSGKYRKYLTFTHTPEEGKECDYEKLKHNIDPEKDGRENTYIKKKFGVSDKERLRGPDKKYRVHAEDRETVKKYKK